MGIYPKVMYHWLNIDPKHKGIQQKRRAVSEERVVALAEEVDRLLDVGLIRGSFYPEWLENPVLVKKPNGKWRTCVNFTDLNNACPKDSFPLPRIDQLVDATAGHALLSFMDAYSSYNQISMYELDQEHTSFITDRDCEDAFHKIKEQLGNPPMLAKPEDGETLVLYLAVSEYSIRATLVKEEEGRQLPVYYVRTAYPLRHILHKPESSGRMLKWAIELGQFDLEYCPYTAIKGQALADFILEFDFEVDDKAIIGVGAGIVLVTPEGHYLMSTIHFKFYVTDNDVEYEALINGLKIALEMGVVNLTGRSNSELVVNQVNGGFQARGPWTELYMRCVQRMLRKFGSAKLEGVPEEKNSNADALEKMGSQIDSVFLGQIPLKIQEIPSIPEVSVFQMQDIPQETWITPIHNYIRTGTLPEDKLQARHLHYQAVKYVEYDGVQYKRGFIQLLLRCVDLEEGNYILRELHKAASITSLASPWPFVIWRIDLIGELPKAKRGVKYVVIAVDYFTKWAEAMSLATIIAKKIKYFIFNSIVCRFGIPYKLISDQGKQFDSKELRKLCEDLNIKKDFAAVYHPQSNGQTEAINKIIKHTLKAKLEEKKGDWPE
ncbi:uncharacterized protein LOC141665320 [Apium graveolens]|uniref:uncharacterized protein LOC141665320 n=1 Tax=Apium graveolens TaxID=4045 RepID=UPI003D78CE0F